jgi:hypothetical protein
MTTNHTTGRWRTIAATPAVFIAAVSFGTAATADAEPPAGAVEFLSCVQDRIATYGGNSMISSDLYWKIQEDCCLDLNGTYNEGTRECYLPNGQDVRPTPPPRASIIPHPGDPGPLGPGKPAPPPSAVVPPDLNQTGIQ